MKKKNLFIIGFVLLLTSCVVENQSSTLDNLRTWIGLPKYRVIEKFGLPTREGSDGMGGEIIEYHYNRGTTHIPYKGNIYSGNVSNVLTFFIGSDGLIYRAKYD